MDDAVTKDPEDIGYNEFTSPSGNTTYAEALRAFAPFFLSCGMTHDQYWKGNPYMVEEFLSAYMLRREEENWQAWLVGIYAFDAVSTALSNIHFDKKSHKVNLPTFKDKPIDIRPKTEDRERYEARQAEMKLIAQLNKLKDKWDKKDAR